MAAPITIGTDLVCGNFEQTRFCAASILSFSSSVGWGSESSSVSVELVEDKCKTNKKYYFGGLNTVGGTANRDLLWGNVAQYTTGKDRFTKPVPGTPAYFQFAEFSFQGLVRDWEYKFASSGDTISVNLSSPSQLLNDSVVILDGFNGVNLVDLKGMPNLLPFFGWSENTNGVTCNSPNHTATAFNEFAAGVGGINYAPTAKIFGTIKNSDGVDWGQVRNYLRQLDPAVCFAGYCYTVDFSALPGSPGYKLPGTHMTLMQIVERVCEDHGYDFYCYLTNSGKTIAVSVIDRKLAPVTGIIEGYVAGNEHVVSSSYGREMRDELCNSFLVGDNVKVVWQMELGCTKANASDDNCGIWPYWGHINGNAIIGEGINNDHTFFVDARTWGIPGLPYYIIDVGEIRAALSGRDNWEDYFLAIVNSVAAGQVGWPALKTQSVTQKKMLEPRLGLSSTINLKDLALAFGGGGGGVGAAKGLLQEWANKFIARKNKSKTNNPQKTAADIIFENVVKMGNDYYGKKYMVRIPWQCYDMRGMVGRDDFRMDTNWELAEGGWTEAYDVIGLNRVADPFGFEKFRSDEGLTTSFALFQPMNLHQPKGFTEENSWQNPAVNPNRAWVKASPTTDEGDRGFVFKNATLRTDPRAVMTLAFNPMLTKAAIGEDNIPNDSNLLKIFLKLVGATDAQALELLNHAKNKFKTAPLASVDIPGLPAAIAVPMRSTRITYGPWTNTNGFELGKTEFIKDTEVVPWNFGSVATMNLAARLKVDYRQSKQLMAEKGNIQIAGAPIVNLAGFLGGPSGPYITGIDCSVGSSGVTTSFNLQTFTPKFGNLASGIVANLQRLNQFNNISRKLMLANAIASKKQAIRDQGGSTQGGGKGGGGSARDDGSPGAQGTGGMATLRKSPVTDDKTFPVEFIAGDVSLRDGGTLENSSTGLNLDTKGENLIEGDAMFINYHQYQGRMARHESDYLNKWGVEVEGLWRGFSTAQSHNLLPTYTKAQTAEPNCKEKHPDGLGPASCSDGGSAGCDLEIEKPLNFLKPMIPPSYTEGGGDEKAAIPIICQTLDPYMMGTDSSGKLPGVAMDTPMHDGSSAPTDLNYMVRGNPNQDPERSLDIEVDKYQDGDNIRGAALRGPLLVAGWGYDIDGFPVPNDDPANPNNKFSKHWLHKPKDWKVGPVDLRWDEDRGVWSAAGAFKLVRVKLDSWVNPGSEVKGVLVDESEGSGDKEVCVYNNTDRPLRKDWVVIAWYDTTTCTYYVIEAYKPIYKVKSEECSLTPSKGKIEDAGGAPVGSQSREVKFEGSTKQPLWDGQVVYTTAICVDDEGVETHRILQGEFRGYDTVVWVNCIPTSGSTGATGSTSAGAGVSGCVPEDDNCTGYGIYTQDPLLADGWTYCNAVGPGCGGYCDGECNTVHPDSGLAEVIPYNPQIPADWNELKDFQESSCWEWNDIVWGTAEDPEWDEHYINYVVRTKCRCSTTNTCDDTYYDTDDDDDDCEDYELCIQVRKLWLQTPAGEKKKYQGDEMGEDCEPKEADATPDCGEGGSSGGGSSGSSSGSGS